MAFERASVKAPGSLPKYLRRFHQNFLCTTDRQYPEDRGYHPKAWKSFLPGPRRKSASWPVYSSIPYPAANHIGCNLAASAFWLFSRCNRFPIQPAFFLCPDALDFPILPSWSQRMRRKSDLPIRVFYHVPKDEFRHGAAADISQADKQNFFQKNTTFS